MILTFSTFFFVLVAALLVERFFDCSKLRYWGWVSHYHDLVDKRFAGKNSIIIVLIMLVPLALLVSILELNLRLWFYGVFGIVFEFAVLLYSFGPRSAWQDAETLKVASEADGLSILDVEASSVRAGAWLLFVRRVISPACWFILLGAGGVFFYRLAEVAARLLSKKSETVLFANRARSIVNGFDWLPIRLFGLLFALAGHFALVMQEWKKRVWSSSAENESLLVACGDAGVGLADSQAMMDNALFIKELSGLIERSLIIFMVILAFLVLILLR